LYVKKKNLQKKIVSFSSSRLLISICFVERLRKSPKQHFRKESCFLKNPVEPMSNLTLTPTNVVPSLILEGEDYG